MPLHELAVRCAAAMQMVEQAQEQGDVGVRRQRKVQVGFLCRVRGARIEDDDTGAARLARGEDSLEQHRVAPGRVRADQNDEVGLVQVLVGAGHRIGTESADVSGDRRRHAEPRVCVDVRRADETLHQLVGDVIILGQQLP